MSEQHNYAFPEYVYHYTTIEGLKGIISDRKLWLTDIRYLNDKAELGHGYKLINEYQERVGGSKLSIKDDVCIYVASFSLDNNSLSQWRAYAKSGGVAIGFPTNMLCPKGLMPAYRLVKCQYVSTVSQFEGFFELFNDTIHFTKVSDFLSKPDDMPEEDKEMYVNHSAAVIAPAIKHPAFSEEKEFRLILSPDTNNILKDFDEIVGYHKNLPPVKFRLFNGLLKPYREYPLENVSQIRVVVGPNPQQELATKSIKQFLQSATPSFDVEKCVTVSDVPYRDI